MKKIIIFTSSGGGGHISVTNALKEYLNQEHEVESILTFSQVLGPIDPIQFVTFRRYTGEQFYNVFVRKQWFGLLNFMYWVGKRYFYASSKRAEHLITSYLYKHRPDMVISVIPLINDEILNTARLLDIPFLLVPTDLDATMFIQGLEAPHYHRFRLSLSFDDNDIKKTIEPAEIPEDHIVTTGFALRPNFFETKEPPAIRQEFNVPENKPVILLLMGAQGSRQLYAFSRQLARLTSPAHILICLGKNEKLRKKIEAIPFPAHVTTSTLSFTKRIDDLLAISDLFITKSGSVSFCEGIYMNVPMLLDGTSSVLFWERFNHSFLKTHGIGDIITKREELPKMIDHLLAEDHKLASMKKKLQAIEKKNSIKELRELIRRMLQEI